MLMKENEKDSLGMDSRIGVPKREIKSDATLWFQPHFKPQFDSLTLIL